MFKRHQLAWLALAGWALLGTNRAQAERLWPKPAAPMEQALGTGSVEERRRAAAQVAQLSEAQAHALVRRFIQDDDQEVRQRLGAVAVAHCYGDLAEVALSWTQSSAPRERWLAVQLLACDLGADAVRRVGQLLGDSEEEVRHAATLALRKARPKEAQLAADFLLLALSDRSPEVLASAIEALAVLGAPSAVLPLVARLTDDDQDVRYQVARALTAYADARAIPALLMALSDSDARVVEQAVWALGECGEQQAVAGLLSVLSQPTFGAAQLAALSVLTRLDSEQANLQLERLTSRPEARKVIADNRRLLATGPLDFSACIQRATFAELEFCAQMHLAKSAPLGPVLGAVRDHRLSWQDLYRLASTAPSVSAADPARDAVTVHALEVVSLPEYEATEFEFLRGAALDFLLRQASLPQTSQAPLIHALGREKTEQGTLRLLEALGRSGVLGDPSHILPYLASDSPLVRQTAARTLLDGQGRGDIMETILFHELLDVVQAGSAHLAQGMTDSQTAWVVERAARAPLSKQSPLKQTLYGATAVTAPQHRDALLSLWTRQAGHDRSWLLSAIASSLDDKRLREVLLTTTPSERISIAQLAAERPDLAGLLRELSSAPEDRLAAVALESRGYVDPVVQGDEYLALAQGRPLFVQAAALRALRRAWARGVVVFDPKWLSTQRCASSNAGLATAAWGWSAELNQACAGGSPIHQLLTHPDRRVRLEIARGLQISAAWGQPRSALLRCALFEPDAEVAQLCAASQSKEQKPTALAAQARSRVKMSVPWMSGIPASFPFLIVLGARPRLMVSDDQGMIDLRQPLAAVLDVSLAY